MGTVSAVVVVCVLLISAAITLILILVTVPSELDQSIELPSTFSQTNRAFEIHSPTHHPPAPVGNKQTPLAGNQSIGLLPPILLVTITPVSSSSGSTASTHKVSSNKSETPVATNQDSRIASRLIATSAVAAEDIRTTTPQSVLETVSTRKRDFLTLTLRYGNRPHESRQPELKSKVRKTGITEVETNKLEPERKIKLPPDHRIVGIAFEQQLLHVGTADGKVRIYNSTSGEQVHWADRC